MHSAPLTCQVPPVVVNHEPQIPRDNIIKLFEPITHVFVKVFVAKVHDLDGKFATQLSQTRDDSQKLSRLMISCSENDSATTVAETGVQ